MRTSKFIFFCIFSCGVSFADTTACPLSTNIYFWDRLMEIRRDARSSFDQMELKQQDLEKQTALFKLLIEPHKKGLIPERQFLEAEKNLQLAKWDTERIKILYKETKAKEKVAELHAKCIKTSEEAISLLESYGGIWEERFDDLTLEVKEADYLHNYEIAWLNSLKKSIKEGTVTHRHILEHDFRVKQAKNKLEMVQDELSTTKDALAQIKEQIDEVRRTKTVDLDSIILSPPHVD